jgi:thioredoxin reductase (NADPH)
MTPGSTPLDRGELSSRPDHIFPTLTEAQVARIAQHGTARPVQAGEVLVEEGAKVVPFFVVTKGHLEIVRLTEGREFLVAVHGPGQFTGEVNMLSGRRSLFLMRASEPAEVIEMNRADVQALVQTDADLGEILMRAFILRRVELVAHGLGDGVLLGSQHSADTLRIKAFLTRNNHPYTYLDLDVDADAQGMLDRFHVTTSEVPVMICRGTVLKNPGNQKIAECLGFNDANQIESCKQSVVRRAGLSWPFGYCLVDSFFGTRTLRVAK